MTEDRGPQNTENGCHSCGSRNLKDRFSLKTCRNDRIKELCHYGTMELV